MVDFGAGPVLDENFDFSIDSRGDIETNESSSNGLSELEKDLAVNIAEVVEDVGLGGQLSLSTQEDLRIDIGSVVNNDPRISGISQLVIEKDEDRDDQLNVDMTVNTADGPFDLVIPVST